MKKNGFLHTLCLLLAAVLLFSGCAFNPSGSSQANGFSNDVQPEERIPVRLYAIKGPTGISMVNLVSEDENGRTANDYDFQAVSSPDEVVAKLSSGEADIAAVPTNLAAALYAKTSGNIQMLAVNTKGVLYLMEAGESIQSVSDLKGKTVYSTGQGANPEYVLRYVLEQNGLDPDADLTLQFVSENDELAALLASGEAQVALVPEPLVTTVKTKNDHLRVALDMTQQWDAVSGGKSQLLMGCVVVRRDFAEQNPQAVSNFLEDYQASVDSVSDLENTAALCEEYGIIPSAQVAKAAIPQCNIVYLAGQEMTQQVSGYFQVLYSYNPKSVGGALPGEDFYFAAS